MEGKRVIPRIERDEWAVGSCDVCTIYDIIGTNEELSDLFYTAPDLEYNYGYDYITLTGQGEIYCYYIGKDRFCRFDGKWGKEYELYECAIFDERATEELGSLLFSHLTALARTTGCTRIICHKKGGNALFYEFLTEQGFESDGDLLSLPLHSVDMPLYDRLVIPTDEDALGLEELFFLREQGFVIDEEKCLYEIDGERILIDRRDGACQFSEGIRVFGGEMPAVTDKRSLYLVDICRQLMWMGYNKNNINIYLPSAKDSELTPDVRVGGVGIFISGGVTEKYGRQEFRMKLKLDGRLSEYVLYEYRFDEETGGAQDTLRFIKI